MTEREAWTAAWRALADMGLGGPGTAAGRMALGDHLRSLAGTVLEGRAVIGSARFAGPSRVLGPLVEVGVLWEEPDGRSWSQVVRIPLRWCRPEMVPVVEVMRA